MYVYDDDAPGARYCLHVMPVHKRCEGICAVLEYLACSSRQHLICCIRTTCVILTTTPEPNDLRGPYEGVEEYRDSGIAGLEQVADGLVAAASQVHVPECAVIYYSEVLPSLGRNIHMPSS